MNKVQILGTITRDIDLQYAPSGTAIAKVGIAVNKRYTSNGEKKEEVSYFNCVAFGKTGENINQYFQKGSRILISGELKEDRWENSRTDSIRTRGGKYAFIRQPNRIGCYAKPSTGATKYP